MTVPSNCSTPGVEQLLAISVNEIQAVGVEGGLALEHVGGIGEPEALSRYLDSGVPNESMEEGKVFLARGIVDDISPQLRATVGIPRLLALINHEAPYAPARELTHGVVVEKSLHDEQCLRSAALAK